MVTRRDMKTGNTATIVIKNETRERLRRLSKNMDDTFDIIINRIIDSLREE
jgi:predicted DNA-binding protein